MCVMIAKWMPEWERSRGTTIIFTGSSIGMVVSIPVAGLLCDGTFMGGWPAVFIVFGLAGCVWVVLWTVFVYESPDTHPYISIEEYEFIVVNQTPDECRKSRVIPWKSIFTSIPVYALVITHFCNNWTTFTLLALLPMYLRNILDISIPKVSLITSVTHLSHATIAWLAAYISDIFRKYDTSTNNIIRKTNNTIAFVGPALCLLAVIYTRCNITETVILLIIATGLHGCHFSGFKSTHIDMAPDFSGVLYGLTNAVANIGNMISPLVTALFLDQGHTLSNWASIFYISILMYILGTGVYIVFASVELQCWAVHANNHNIQSNSDADKSKISKNH
ncbi:unnamed protein product [Oppiella nova]|uniref:Major facilitator superfamily (MFS) profile domain-containing protein n=1 Tax=Oppiella nova TaxID=334625 RepID=A0A7R9M3Q4_9ACAR|nr:unnamed protein product [Oppiella nova]CAG2170188.1 unnamed protein product [Oppiella nova]